MSDDQINIRCAAFGEHVRAVVSAILIEESLPPAKARHILDTLAGCAEQELRQALEKGVRP